MLQQFKKLLSLLLIFSTYVSGLPLPNHELLENKCSYASDLKTKTHAPMVLDAGDLYIRCGNAVFSGSTIRAKMVDMIVTGNLTIETLLDEFRMESSSTEFSASLSAIFGAVLGIETTPKANSPDWLPKNLKSLLDNPTLAAIPHFRMCDEVKIEERINHVAQLVGTERFYLKVGSLLHSKGAEIGLVPDGIANRSEAESIEAGRILEEKVQESSYHRIDVINPSISELIAAATQVTELQALKAKIAESEVLKGKKILEADKMAQKVEEIYLQTEEQIAKEDHMEAIETITKAAKPSAPAKKEVLPQVPEQEVKLDRTILKALGFERITDKVEDQYFRDKDTEATELFILNQLQVGAQDPFGSNALRRARIAMDNYAELHPEQAKNFGCALHAFGQAMTAGAAAEITAGIVGTAGYIAGAPVTVPTTMVLAIFASAYYMFDKGFELIGEGISAGIEKASELIASKFTSNTEAKSELTADVEFLGNTILFGLAAKGGVKSIKPKAQGFRVLRKVSKENIPSHATPKTFHREVEWTAPTGTKQTYRVVQRNDIDWMKIRENTRGSLDFVGKTNLEAALEKGLAPELADGSIVNLHHVGQKSLGPLIELAPSEHTSVLHKEFGYRKKHPELPVNQKDFRKERPEYWKTRALEIKNEK